MIVLVVDNVFSVYLHVHLDHDLREASSEEHDCFFVVVGVEESAWDVNGGDGALFVGIDGGGDHDAVSCYSW